MWSNRSLFCLAVVSILCYTFSQKCSDNLECDHAVQLREEIGVQSRALITISDNNTEAIDSAISDAVIKAKKFGEKVRNSLQKLRGVNHQFFLDLLTAAKIYICENQVDSGGEDAPNIRFVEESSSRAYKDSSGNCTRLHVTSMTDDTVRQEYSAGKCEVQPNCFWSDIHATTDVDRIPVYATTESVQPAAGSMTYPDAKKKIKKWIQGLAIFIIPGIVLSILSLITFLLFLLCRCCCNRCGGRQAREGGYTCSEKSLPVLFFFIFGSGVIVVAALSLSYQKTFVDSVSNTLDEASNTLVQVDGWLANISTPLQQIRDTVTGSATQISTAMNGADFIEEGTDSIVDRLKRFSSDSANRTLPFGCRVQTDLICVPCQICNQITTKTAIVAGQVKTNAGEGVSQLKVVRRQLLSKIVDIADNVKSQVNEQVGTIGEFRVTVNDSNGDVADIKGKYNDYKKKQQFGVLVFFGLTLITIVLGFLGIIFGLTPLKSLANIIHVAWFIGFIALILTFIISAIFASISVILSDACELTLEVGNNWSIALGNELGKAPNACFRNESLIDAFNLSSALSFATGGIQFPNQINVTGMLDFSELDTFQQSILAADTSTFNFSAPLDTTITLLGEYTNQAGSGTSCTIQDVYTRTNILTPWVDVSQPQGTASNGSDFLSKRYATIDSACGQSSSAKAFQCTLRQNPCTFSAWIVEIYNNASALKNVEIDANSFIRDLHANITQISTFVDTFETKIRNLDSAVRTIKEYLSANLIRYVEDFKNAMYCSFIADCYMNIYESLCGDLTPALTMISLMLFLAGIFTFPVNICLIIIVKRLKAKMSKGPILASGMKFK